MDVVAAQKSAAPRRPPIPPAAVQAVAEPQSPPETGSHHVSEHWEDAWLRANWDATPETIEHAFGLGHISLRQYLEATHDAWLADLDARIIAGVADTLTIDEALLLLRRRRPE